MALPAVVGVNLPTFVERATTATGKAAAATLSSGLTSRPSLSAHTPGPERGAALRLSSGLTSRPSLSVGLGDLPVLPALACRRG